MAMKDYSTFFKAPKLEPRHLMQFSVIPRTLVGREGSYTSAKVQSVYSAALVDRVVLWKGHSLQYHRQQNNPTTLWFLHYAVMVNLLNSALEVSEFEQSGYYIHFWMNTLENGMDLLIPLQLLVESYHCCSTRMDLALNNLWWLICYQTKKLNHK